MQMKWHTKEMWVDESATYHNYELAAQQRCTQLIRHTLECTPHTQEHCNIQVRAHIHLKLRTAVSVAQGHEKTKRNATVDF